MRLATLTFIVIASFVSAMAQISVNDLESNKKSLEKDLIKHAPYVYDVDFSGCDATIKISYRGGGAFSFGTSSFVGGGFPRDDGSGSFSAGPGNEVRFGGSSSRFVLRLSELNADDITVLPQFRRDLSTVKITGSSSGTIGVLRKGVVTPRREFTVAVKRKASAKVADIFRSLISQCKNPI